MLAFGAPVAGKTYMDRAAAFGIAENSLGQIALAQVTKPGKAPYFDLPGGAVDGDETEREAVVREFGEETGLVVEAGALVETVKAHGGAGQTFCSTTRPGIDCNRAPRSLDYKRCGPCQPEI